ncbi:MAG: YkgJ family cysteine cluster protein [Candidatus Methanomethylophilaceae archaeon]|nr:YkgJ family cysteine cluster protein [Candidatus Methanomethylophilaceae archaeon]
MADYEVDYSEVTGRLVSCPEQCGMCCLCQPEVPPEERPFFKKNYPQFLVRTKGPQPYSALALKKGCGSCVFLENRRCKVYDHRTAYCRQFPYHIYASDRVKVELDLSCRGAWEGKGNDALTEAKELIKAADSRITEAIAEAKEVYREFYANCKEAGVYQDPSMLRMTVSENVSMFTDLAYLSRIMDMSQIEPIMALAGTRPETQLDMESLEEAGKDLAMDSMSSNDPLSVPVYCDKDWNWNMFMAQNGRIEWMVMDDDGNLIHKAFADATDIKLKVPDSEGVKVLTDYVNTLNQRDSFLGSVFSMMDQNGYEDDMTNAYFGSMAVTVMDLLWRMSMLDHFMGTGVGAEGVREAIIFYDMDRLDAPAIGAFV